MFTDTVSDFLVRIKNAGTAKKERVDVPSSKFKIRIAKILKEEGFIKNFKYIGNKKQGILRVYLKYSADREHIIDTLMRVSKASKRVYWKAGEIPRVIGRFGIAVLSTSRGLMTHKQARKEKTGGEVVCFVW